MCVLIIKPKGVKMPDARKLQMAFKANPHGCGCASSTKFFKSLSFDTFMRKLAKVGDDENCMIHFRFATHGSIKRANCHPFKQGDVYFAHNGIIDIDRTDDRTDSETAFDEMVYPAILRYGWNSEEVKTVASNLCQYGSKIALMQNGELLMFGNFIQDADGCYYSNHRFMYCANSFAQ
ncbi:class II glutamine amidotransferase [Duncaniella muris]|uniref:Glutamine amidotransferase type-2 domain-containing protein n=1 Tax=Duncaniella muris TaxID=2094150 RepID=A0A2V1IHX0_9BACT|nr:class II glutamine amidotransferase [Duncaniella muris]PWB00214.1 hypothetical protein C5O23_13500 [Duncaniella muris]